MDLLKRNLALKVIIDFQARTWAVPEHSRHLDGPSRICHELTHIETYDPFQLSKQLYYFNW